MPGNFRWIVLAAWLCVALLGCGGGDGPAVIPSAQGGGLNTNPPVTSPTEASAQTITFGTAPPLTLGGAATVSAMASSGLPVSYASSTPLVCAVDASSGSVTDLAAGNCSITASQAGNAQYSAAAPVVQDMVVLVPQGVTVPGVPGGVAVKAGGAINTVIVSIGAVNSGGSPITRYSVVSSPGGITATGTSLPITVACPSTCHGQAFTVQASNLVGDGVASAPVEIITRYNVLATFYEPDTQPRDSIFTGSFSFNATTGVVSDLQGALTESMTGSPTGVGPFYDMTQLTLAHQLSSVHDTALGGHLVTTFLLNTTATLSTMNGGDGWSPGTGYGLYNGFPGVNPGNAYVRIFVNETDPAAPLTPAQIDKLAYADCAPGGMMSATCMTGTTVAGYGSVGTMSGYPVSQVITKQP